MFVNSIKNKNVFIAIISSLVLLFITIDSALAVPPMPLIYSGTVEVTGEPIVNSVMEIDTEVDEFGSPVNPTTYGELICVTYCLHAQVGDWVTASVPIKNGIFTALSVGPPDSTYNNLPIYFYIYDVPADQTEVFKAAFLPSVTFDYKLTFPKLPDPTPTPIPTMTPTPVIAQPSVYSGSLIISGASEPPANAVLVAKIGPYTSPPALIDSDSYKNLILNPSDIIFEGMKIEFYLNGYKSLTTDVFKNGSFNLAFPLLFTAIPIATATPVPATAIPVVIPTVTPTPVPPIIKTIIVTPTPLPPTSTPIPTNTPTPTPTITPIPPTPIVLVVTATPESNNPTPVPLDSGGCFSTNGDLSITTGAVNLFFLISPILFIICYRIYRKK